MSTDTGVQIERFLCLPEQKAIERRWTANDIIKLRNPVEAAEYPVSNMQALKLRELLAQHTMAKTTSFTYGMDSGLGAFVADCQARQTQSWHTRWVKRVLIRFTALERMRL